MQFSNAIYLLAWYLRGFSEMILFAIGLGVLSACPYVVRAIFDKR